MPIALLALAIGGFGIGMTEFMVVGLLPQVAGTFGVSIPTAGYLVSGYAIGVLAGAPLMTILGRRIPRKRMLMLLMGIFIAGNALSASAPDFGVMLAGRLVTSLTHGAFFGIGSVVAAGMVAPPRRAAAIAVMFTGLTAATVAGVPLGTWLGQHAGWRASFWTITAVGVVALACVAALVPSGAGASIGGDVQLRGELRVLRNVQVQLAMAMTVLGFGGVFAAITYIAVMMTHVTGYADSSVTWLLALFGLGFFAGNLIGGRLADRALMPLLYVSLGGLAVTLALFTLTAHGKVAAAVTIFLVGAFGFASVPPLQKRVLDQAGDAPTLASALNIGAFNLGNALSAWLGGLVIAAGFGYLAPDWVGALLTGSAVILAVVSHRLERRSRQRVAAVARHEDTLAAKGRS